MLLLSFSMLRSVIKFHKGHSFLRSLIALRVFSERLCLWLFRVLCQVMSIHHYDKCLKSIEFFMCFLNGLNIVRVLVFFCVLVGLFITLIKCFKSHNFYLNRDTITSKKFGNFVFNALLRSVQLVFQETELWGSIPKTSQVNFVSSGQMG